MTAHELLAQLRANGVELKAQSDDRLVIDAPKGTITEEVRHRLSQHKVELLQILKNDRSQIVDAPVASSPSKSKAQPAGVPTIPFQTPSPAERAIAVSVADEIEQLQNELMRLRTEEEARRAEAEAERLAADNALRIEQERWHEEEQRMARRRAEQERQRIEAEARDRAEEENRRRIADQQIVQAEHELARVRAMEQQRRHEVDAQMAAAQETHIDELAALRQAEEGQARRRADEERRYLESEARKRAQEEELRRRADTQFRAVEEEIQRVQAREDARVKAEFEAQRLVEEAERRRVEEDARRKSEEEARQRAEQEARLRAEIETQLRAEAAERRRIEEEARRQAEEEARRRAEEEARVLAAERARRQAEEEAQRRAEAEARRQAEEAARLQAEEEARRRAEEQKRIRAEQEARERAAAEARERAALEARIRAEVQAKIRAEEAEEREAEDARRRPPEKLDVEGANPPTQLDHHFDLDKSEAFDAPSGNGPASVSQIQEWFEMPLEGQKEIAPFKSATFSPTEDRVYDNGAGEFREVGSAAEYLSKAGPASSGAAAHVDTHQAARHPTSQDTSVFDGEDAFHRITAGFDDPSQEVRNSTARALFDFQEDRAAAFTRALRDALPERRRRIGSAIATSGLANEAIGNLIGESRDKTYDAFSLLFLMAKAGEVQSLMRTIEEHPNLEVRLAVVKLLALSGQSDILPSFRRMAVRGSLPPEVRSAVMEAIYQMTSQSPAEASSIQ